jgi:hypothetical protein
MLKNFDAAEVALALSILTALAQALNAWFGQRVRADIAEMRAELLDAIDERFVRKLLCEVEMGRCRERFAELCDRVQAIEARNRS